MTSQSQVKVNHLMSSFKYRSWSGSAVEFPLRGRLFAKWKVIDICRVRLQAETWRHEIQSQRRHLEAERKGDRLKLRCRQSNNRFLAARCMLPPRAAGVRHFVGRRCAEKITASGSQLKTQPFKTTTTTFVNVSLRCRSQRTVLSESKNEVCPNCSPTAEEAGLWSEDKHTSHVYCRLYVNLYALF